MARISWLLIPLMVAAAGEARAYCLLDVGATSPYVSWPSSPVTYRVSGNLTNAQLLGAIDAAFASWGAVSCSTLAFSKGAQFTPCVQTPCAANTVQFTQNTGTIDVFWYDSATGFPTSSQYVAYVHVIHDGQGKLLSAAIAINAFNYTWNATGGSVSQQIFDLQNEMTAFVGQAIGLSDSNVAGASLYPGSSYGDTTKRALDPDDINGVVYLYQVASCAAPPAPGANGCSALPPDAGVPDGAAALDGGVADGPTVLDGGPLEAAVGDTGALDASLEASTLDAPVLDGQGPETSADLAGGDLPALDTAAVDAGAADSGSSAPDAGVSPDQGAAADSGAPDAGPIGPVDEGCDCRVGLAANGVPAGLVLLGLLCLAGWRRRG